MVSIKEFVVNWADRAESALKKGYRLFPPEEIYDYLDLLGRGWGWDMLAPCSGSHQWPAYKKYLKEFYRCNSAESISQAWQNGNDDSAAVNPNTDGNALTPRSSLHDQEDCIDGNGNLDGGILVPLVSLCTEMENQFIFECQRQGKADQTADHIMLSEEIKECALSLKDKEGELPVAAAALMFIIKMAELMCERMRHGAYNPDSEITKVRRYALDLMMYRGSDSDCAAAVLVGISKETKKICECLRQGRQAETLPWPKSIMENGWDILSVLHDECISSSNGSDTAATNTGNTTQMNNKKPDCDKDSEDMGNIVKIYSEITSDSMIDTKELAIKWASSAQDSLNMDLILVPPVGIFDHLDLLGKGWGWNRLVPYIGSNDWSSYKNYLKQYYWHNVTKLGAQACLNEKVAISAAIGNINGNELTAPCLNVNRDVTHWRKEQEACTAGNGSGVGNGLAHLVWKCVNMEEKFIFEFQQQGVVNDASGHIILSGEIQKCALSLVNLEGEFPVAAAALKCIMKSAELMCEWLRLGTSNLESMVTDVRQYALNFMMYRGSEYACAAAVMLGIAKETKKICKCLRQGESITRVRWSKTIMENGWDVLEMLYNEVLCAGNGDGTAASEAGNPPWIYTVGTKS